MVKRKTALLVSYNGSAFKGSQLQNTDVRTVERDLEQALYEAGCIAPSNHGNLSKVNWSRASRTDKGVHALCTVFAMKMLYDERPTERLLEDINSRLNSDIRLIGLRLVVDKFDAKKLSSYREYEYLFPYQALTLERTLDESVVQELNKIASKFQGTHKFHNYTRKLKMGDPQAKRYIVKFEALEPIQHNQVPFLRFKLTGQSFLYHQIRKMIAMTLGVFLEHFSLDAIQESFESENYFVPLAPAEGLMLSQISFVHYNRKNTHRPIAIGAQEEQQMQEFLETNLLPEIYSHYPTFLKFGTDLKSGNLRDYDDDTSKPSKKAES